MKKLLFILIALGILLVGCGSIVGTLDKTTGSSTFNAPTKTPISPETSCHVSQNQLSLLIQEVQRDSTELAVRSDTPTQRAIKVTLLKLHLRIQQLQKALKGCMATSQLSIACRC